jgi:putative ABC transport system substrate-binding protein
MLRREFMTILSGAAAAWPLAARAQQQALPVIGVLSLSSRDTYGYALDAFRRGLGDSGYVEGRNVAIEYRWADTVIDRLQTLATDLARGQVAVIAAIGGLAAARAANAATSTIPIVFAIGGDPVRMGLVASLNRPGGNATGVSLFSADLLTKRLEVARDLLLDHTLVAVLMNPTSPEYDSDLEEFQKAADAIGQPVLVLKAATANDFPAAFESLLQKRAKALLVMTDVLFNSRRNELVALAASHAVPMIHFLREAVEAGGLISYGSSIPELYANVGRYVGRVLKGDKPADLPVLRPTKIELVVNLKTAKALGLIVPQTLLARADEVIE